MFLKLLKLYNFRNIKTDSIAFEERVNFITGQNGAGKTNLIEAISILSTCKQLRGKSAAELVSWGKDEFSVFGLIASLSGDKEIGVSYG
ncbi:MAG: DNA replication and repair protein RecF, partial [Candidatus Dadabacteria bacterium]